MEMESDQTLNVSLVPTFYSSQLLTYLINKNLLTEVSITASSSADMGSTFEATAHLVPQIDVGLSVLGGVASTNVFMDLDASADFTASTTSANPQPCVTASADINVGVGAEGSFFGLFNASVVKSLFDKRFPLFQVRAQGLPHTTFLSWSISHLVHTTEMFRGSEFDFKGPFRHCDTVQFEASPRFSPSSTTPSTIWAIVSSSLQAP